jgi:diguanylate cyclase
LTTTASAQQAYSAAREAVRLLEAEGLPATAEAYAVALRYAQKSDPALNGAVEKLLAAGAPSPDAWLGLHQQFFPEAMLSRKVMAAGDAMAQELRGVTASLKAAEAHTRSYGDSLHNASDRLVDSGDSRALIEAVLTSTREMEAHARALEQQLQESAAELNALRETLEQVRSDAMTDSLTGVANRKRFELELTRLATEADRTRKPMCLVLADIDHFKRVNDTWGHQTGDQIIRFVATVLQRAGREGDLIARYGGEEFAMLLPGANMAEAQSIAEEARRAIEQKKLVRRSTNEDLGTVTMSFGVAQRALGEAGDNLIDRADRKLYESKSKGRNRVTVDNGGFEARAIA